VDEGRKEVMMRLLTETLTVLVLMGLVGYTVLDALTQPPLAEVLAAQFRVLMLR
jgi:hypothetical protein